MIYDDQSLTDCIIVISDHFVVSSTTVIRLYINMHTCKRHSISIALLYFLFTSFYVDADDIIDETLTYFRANVFFRNFDVKGKADRTLIYLTLYTHYLLGKAEKIEDRATGKSVSNSNGFLLRHCYSAAKEFHNLAIKQFLIPGENGWPLGTLFPSPANRTEAGLCLCI